jgi:hypothetical protein
MLVTNTTNQEYWFGPLVLPPNAVDLDIDDTSDTSLYLTDDSVADAINTLAAAGKITVTGAASPFPRPTGSPEVLHGDGSPEGYLYAGQGSLYLRRDTATVYTKTTGIHQNTGWTLVASSGEELDYAERTSNIAIPASTLIVSGAAIAYDGTTTILIEFFAEAQMAPTAGNKLYLYLYEDGSKTSFIGWVQNPAAAQMNTPVHVSRRFTPAAGTHTYAIYGEQIAGTPTILAGSGTGAAQVPAYIRISKV